MTKQHCKYTTSVDVLQNTTKSYCHLLKSAHNKSAVSLLKKGEWRYII